MEWQNESLRGIEASLAEAEAAMWETEHKKLLMEMTPDEFEVLHYGAAAELINRNMGI